MRRMLAVAFVVALSQVFVACSPRYDDAMQRMTDPRLVERESRLSQSLAAPDTGPDAGKAIARWLLPEQLREVSGLTLTTDGRMLAHGDERGLVSEIDYRRGVLVKQFNIGNGLAGTDFEGIAAGESSIYMITSEGDIYEFKEGVSRSRVDFVIHKTKLDEECEFEGIAYEASSKSLVLACKNVKKKDWEDQMVLFRWQLSAGGEAKESEMTRISVPLADLTAGLESEQFRPTDIAIDPNSGNYLLVSAQDHAIAEITPNGQVVFVRAIPEDHQQAEGIAITKDGIMIISDEAGRTSATLTLYRRPG